MSDVIKKGGKPMPSNKGLTMDEFTEYRRIIHEAVKMFQNLPVDEQRSILSYSRIDDTIGKPVLYSDGEISREIEEYPDNGDDLDAVSALNEFATNFIKEWVDDPIQDGWHHLYHVVNHTLSEQAAEIEQKDKRIADLEGHIRKRASYCEGVANLIKHRNYDLIDAGDQIEAWQKEKLRLEKALKGSET